MATVAPAARAGVRQRTGTLFNVLAAVVVGLFIVNLIAMAGSVVLNSFANPWFETWFPEGWSTKWYQFAVRQFQLGDVLITTAQVAGAVVALSLLIGTPAAYVLARHQFAGKKLVLALFVLPMIFPPITYGIPLATILYETHLAGTVAGIVLANLVPNVPFVIFIMTLFIEQVNENIEKAARMCGASTWRMFTRILVPLVAPGALAAALIVFVRVLGMFELTFLTAGPGDTTLVVALYEAVFATGIRPQSAIDALATVFMLTTLAPLLLAMKFVAPTDILVPVRKDQA